MKSEFRKFKEIRVVKFLEDFKGGDKKVRYRKDGNYAMNEKVLQKLKDRGAKVEAVEITHEKASAKVKKGENITTK